uniref:Uncharacterized protein n=1 Tax=Oryctolagus cuniculus TaxID=9986 RepID=U3KNT2_RABIT
KNKTTTCRAAIAWATNSPLSIEEVQVEPPKPGEVQIKVNLILLAFIFEGIRGFDNHVLKGELPVKFPLIPRHEGAGVVESVGSGRDKVLTLIIPQCRECSSCLHPKGNFCEKQDVLPSSGLMLDGTSRFTCKGKKIYHSFHASTFTEYTVVPEIAVAKIDAAAPVDEVCLISCELPTGYRAAVHTAKVTPDSTCVVFGLGGIGSAIVMGCKASGASRITGVDINEQKFPRARALGVTDCLNPRNLKKPVQEVVVEMTGVGVDFAFEAIGLIDAMVSNSTCFKNDNSCSMDLPQTVELETCYKTRDCILQLVTDYLQNKINIDPLLTHQLSSDKLHEAFELYHAGKRECFVCLSVH